MSSFEKYQENAVRTAKDGDAKFNLIHAAMGLAGESNV